MGIVELLDLLQQVCGVNGRCSAHDLLLSGFIESAVFLTRAAMAKKKQKRSSTSKKKRSHRKGSDRRWSAKVKTVSTYPPKDL